LTGCRRARCFDTIRRLSAACFHAAAAEYNAMSPPSDNMPRAHDAAGMPSCFQSAGCCTFSFFDAWLFSTPPRHCRG
jgi:hypothetical protein